MVQVSGEANNKKTFNCCFNTDLCPAKCLKTEAEAALHFTEQEKRKQQFTQKRCKLLSVIKLQAHYHFFFAFIQVSFSGIAMQ